MQINLFTNWKLLTRQISSALQQVTHLIVSQWIQIDFRSSLLSNTRHDDDEINLRTIFVTAFVGFDSSEQTQFGIDKGSKRAVLALSCHISPTSQGKKCYWVLSPGRDMFF